MSDSINWLPVMVRLNQLDLWADNPKRMSHAQAKRLETSTDKLGRAGALLIGPQTNGGAFPLYDGHQRVRIWSALYGDNLEVNALQAHRPLTDKEQREVSLLTITAQASFDWDILAGWDFEDLTAGGFSEGLLVEWNDGALNLREMLMAEEVIPDFRPVSADEQPRLDQRSPVTCPECGAEFIPK